MSRNCLMARGMIRVVAAAVALFIPVEAAAYCRVTIDLYNNQRRVPGEVNVECIGCHYDGNCLPGMAKKKSKYQKGFGNWAVMSHYGAVRNSFQFAGWYPEDGLRQWQSCTSKLPKPDCIAYNDNNCTGQKAVPERENRYGGYSYRLASGQPCETIGVQTVEEIDMHIVELDWPDGDDPVASLIYGDVHVPLDCSTPWICSGSSDWLYSSSGAGTVNARVQVRVRTGFENIGR